MAVIETENGTDVMIAIVRTRDVALSPNTPEITIAATHSSRLTFVTGGTTGIVVEEVALRNFKGDVLMRAKAGDGREFLAEDAMLWWHSFGIGWKWTPSFK